MHATDCYCVVAHASVESTTLQQHNYNMKDHSFGER